MSETANYRNPARGNARRTIIVPPCGETLCRPSEAVREILGGQT